MRQVTNEDQPISLFQVSLLPGLRLFVLSVGSIFSRKTSELTTEKAALIL